MKNRLVTATVLLLSLSGCGLVTPLANPISSLERVRLGMSQDEVRNAMGSPYRLRTATEETTVWEYRLFATPCGVVTTNLLLGPFFAFLPWFIPDILLGSPETYWLTFRQDGLLRRIGEPHDEVESNQAGDRLQD